MVGTTFGREAILLNAILRFVQHLTHHEETGILIWHTHHVSNGHLCAVDFGRHHLMTATVQDFITRLQVRVGEVLVLPSIRRQAIQVCVIAELLNQCWLILITCEHIVCVHTLLFIDYRFFVVLHEVQQVNAATLSVVIQLVLDILSIRQVVFIRLIISIFLIRQLLRTFIIGTLFRHIAISHRFNLLISRFCRLLILFFAVLR